MATGGEAKLVDFGIARIAGERTLTGPATCSAPSPTWPPSRPRGSARPAADVYSLALTLYECFCGEHPLIARGPGGDGARDRRADRPLGGVRPDLPRRWRRDRRRARPRPRAAAAGLGAGGGCCASRGRGRSSTAPGLPAVEERRLRSRAGSHVARGAGLVTPALPLARLLAAVTVLGARPPAAASRSAAWAGRMAPGAALARRALLLVLRPPAPGPTRARAGALSGLAPWSPGPPTCLAGGRRGRGSWRQVGCCGRPRDRLGPDRRLGAVAPPRRQGRGDPASAPRRAGVAGLWALAAFTLPLLVRGRVPDWTRSAH